MTFKDFFSRSADTYARFRPTYPNELFAYLASITKEHDCAWDCATGNGQAAILLANHFDRVVATDISENQLKHAQAHQKIIYQKASAENGGLPKNSVDLITVAQAFHWFDQELFLAEVKRVAKPDGVVAIWCYGLLKISPSIDKSVEYLYEDILGSFWDQARKLVDNNYADVSLPFQQISSPTFIMTKSWDLDHFIGYLRTWSAYQKFVEEKQIDPLSELIPQFASCWQNKFLDVSWQITPKVWRIK
jgi:SAM-dependent methyltransferase